MLRVIFALALGFGATSLCLFVSAEDRVPIPDQTKQLDSQREIKKLYPKEFQSAKAPKEKLALANTLFKLAVEEKNDLVAKFVVYALANDYAIQAGDYKFALLITDEINIFYLTNKYNDRISILKQAFDTIESGPPAQKLLSACVQEAESLFDDNQPAALEEILAILEKNYYRAQDAAVSTQIKDVIATGREMALQAKTFSGVTALLEQGGQDTNAKLILGKFLCFFKGNWSTGLPFLGEVKDEEIKAAAVKELADPTEELKELEIGDAWTAVAERYQGVAKARILERAEFWYKQAQAQSSGISKIRLDKKLENLKGMQRISFFNSQNTGDRRIHDPAPLKKNPGIVQTQAENVRQALSQTQGAQDAAEPARVTDPVGNFSFIPPKGWDYTSWGGMKYKILRGATVDGFAPNIVIEEATATDTATCVKALEAQNIKTLPKCVIISRGNFITADNHPGKTLVMEDELFNKKLRQALYVFQENDKVFVITASCLAKDGETMETIFYKTIRSLKF